MTEKKIRGVSVTTRLVHGPKYTSKWDFRHHVVPPLSSSSTYRLDSTERAARGFGEYGRLVRDEGEEPIYIYDRLDEPTRSLLEGQLADMEGGDACAVFASGMSAVSGALGCQLKSGDSIIANNVLYGCTHSLLINWYPRLGIKVKRFDFTQPEDLEALIEPSTRIFYFESPVNPNLRLVDIAALRELADRINDGRKKSEWIRIVIDNTFATPFCQRPLELGADVVVHSLTKNLGGFGTDVGGAVICSQDLLENLLLFRKDFGASLSPKAAWPILVYGLPTLPLRLKRQQYTAAIVAQRLRELPLVSKVFWPGLEDFPQYDLAQRQMRDFDGDFAPGNMIYFLVDETRVDPNEFVNHLAKNAYTLTLAVSLGHTKTLIELPSLMTHSSYGESPEMAEKGLRLSIGLESAEDILADLQASLEAVEREPAAS